MYLVTNNSLKGHRSNRSGGLSVVRCEKRTTMTSLTSFVTQLLKRCCMSNNVSESILNTRWSDWHPFNNQLNVSQKLPDGGIYDTPLRYCATNSPRGRRELLFTPVSFALFPLQLPATDGCWCSAGPRQQSTSDVFEATAASRPIQAERVGSKWQATRMSCVAAAAAAAAASRAGDCDGAAIPTASWPTDEWGTCSEWGSLNVCSTIERANV